MLWPLCGPSYIICMWPCCGPNFLICSYSHKYYLPLLLNPEMRTKPRKNKNSSASCLQHRITVPPSLIKVKKGTSGLSGNGNRNVETALESRDNWSIMCGRQLHHNSVNVFFLKQSTAPRSSFRVHTMSDNLTGSWPLSRFIFSVMVSGRPCYQNRWM